MKRIKLPFWPAKTIFKNITIKSLYLITKNLSKNLSKEKWLKIIKRLAQLHTRVPIRKVTKI